MESELLPLGPSRAKGRSPPRRGKHAGRGAAKPRKEAAEYGTRALESTREQLAIHQTVVDDAADRLRAIEHERSHLTADYTQRCASGRGVWVTLRARWVTLRARRVTLRARWVTLRARWVTLRARWVTLRARWVTLRARWVTL